MKNQLILFKSDDQNTRRERKGACLTYATAAKLFGDASIVHTVILQHCSVLYKHEVSNRAVYSSDWRSLHL